MLLNGGEYGGVRYLSEAPQGTTAVLTKGSFGKGGAGGSKTWVDPSTKTIYILLQNVPGVNKDLTESTFLKYGR